MGNRFFIFAKFDGMRDGPIGWNHFLSSLFPPESINLALPRRRHQRASRAFLPLSGVLLGNSRVSVRVLIVSEDGRMSSAGSTKEGEAILRVPAPSLCLTRLASSLPERLEVQ